MVLHFGVGRYASFPQKSVVKIGNIFSVKTKGQLISKVDCQAVNSSKTRTNEFVFTTIRHVFVWFLEEFEDTKKTFRNYLTYVWINILNRIVLVRTVCVTAAADTPNE